MSKFRVEYSQRRFNVNRRAIAGRGICFIGPSEDDPGKRDKEEKEGDISFSESSVLKILVKGLKPTPLTLSTLIITKVDQRVTPYGMSIALACRIFC